MRPLCRLPLATRITVAAVLVALGTVLLLGAGASVLFQLQRQRAQQALALQMLSEQANRVADRLQAVRERIQQAADSSVIATALVDSAGKELYLLPFLQQLGQVSGTPVSVQFVDFEGQPIAASRGTSVTEDQQRWLAGAVQQAHAAAAVFGAGEQAELALVALVHYPRTSAPEGALMAKLRLAELQPDRDYLLLTGPPAGDAALRVPLGAGFEGVLLAVQRRAGLADIPLPGPAGWEWVAAMLGMAVLAAALGGQLLARRLTRDLDDLVSAAERLQLGKATHARLPRAATPDIDLLNRRINGMLDALEQAHRSQVEAAQARAAQALADAANRQKSLFMARVSHELRTPLNAILGFADLMGRVTKLEPRQQEWLRYIDEAGRHLLALVNDLLDLSRVESGAMELHIADVALDEAAAMAMRELEGLAQQHQVRLVADPGLQGVRLRADPTRLRQVLHNLISNAIKYNRPGGSVRVRPWVEDDGGVGAVVEDDGLGMSPSQLAHLFEPFNRLGRECTRVEGTGIGLALSRTLVESMGGHIRVRSAEGRGSSFTVTLPGVGPMPLPASLGTGAAPETAGP